MIWLLMPGAGRRSRRARAGQRPLRSTSASLRPLRQSGACLGPANSRAGKAGDHPRILQTRRQASLTMSHPRTAIAVRPQSRARQVARRAAEKGGAQIMLCCICEKRPGASGTIPVPLCLACRTENRERTVAAETKPIIVSLTPAVEELLIQDGQRRVACGEVGSLAGLEEIVASSLSGGSRRN